MSLPFRYAVGGGTLGLEEPSYISRQADQALYEALQKGEYCYVLNSRQMGKSSLIVRTAARLRQDGLRVAVVELSGFGSSHPLWRHFGTDCTINGNKKSPPFFVENKGGG